MIGHARDVHLVEGTLVVLDLDPAWRNWNKNRFAPVWARREGSKFSVSPKKSAFKF